VKYVLLLGGGGGSGRTPRTILDVLAKRVPQVGPDKKLVAIVLANPRDKFGKNEIFDLIEYWHHRSAEHLLFILPGYKVSAAKAKRGLKKKTFAPKEFVLFLNWLSKETKIKYRSMALLLLVVGERDSDSKWSLDWSHVFEIHLEELTKSKLIESVKTVFEDLIEFAELNAKAPDDAIVMLQDLLNGKVVEPSLYKGLASFVTFWIPKDAQASVKTIAQAKKHFRIVDMRK
jgi:hypothetical protein